MTAIQANLAAIFVSMEHSRSSWLITALLPGTYGRMSKYTVGAGNIAGLFDLFLKLQERSRAGSGRTDPIITIQEAGLDGFWIHRAMVKEGIESHIVDPASVATRRIGRERKALMVERVAHVNRIKGLLFSQGIAGYEPLRRDRRARLEELKTGDGRALPSYMRNQISRELDRLELVMGQIKSGRG